MRLKATTDNIIIKVEKKKIIDPLAVDTGNEDPIVLGMIAAVGPKVHPTIKVGSDIVCAYKNRVAVLPWSTDEYDFYVVKEENIYGILEE